MNDLPSRSEMKLIEQGLRNNWDIPDQTLKFVPMTMLKVLTQGSNKEKIAAARVLAALHQFNNPAPTAQQQINVGVKVDNTGKNDAEAGRTLASEIVERIRLDRLSQDISD